MGGVRVRLLGFTNSSEGYFSRFFSNGFLIKVNSKSVVILIARRFFGAKRLRP